MPEQTKVREIAWRELFPWLMLLRSVRIALMARVLVLGALGLVATIVGWNLITDLFLNSTDSVIKDWDKHSSLQIWMNDVHMHGDTTWVNTTARSAGVVFESAKEWLIHAPIMIWKFYTRSFMAMLDSQLTR